MGIHEKNSTIRLTTTFIISILISCIGYTQTTETISTSGSGTWTVPTGTTGNITVSIWGAGGGGGGSSSNNSGGSGGGGGGASTIEISSYSIGDDFDYTVGAGGSGGAAAGGTGTDGGASTFSNVGLGISLTANGGTGGAGNQGTAGSGGTASGGDTNSSGSGGTTGAASGQAGGASGTVEATSGAGGTAVTNSTGNAGAQPGGGGGGGERNGGTNSAGGAGGDGYIKITYTCGTTAGTASSSAGSVSALDETVTLSVTGNDAGTYQWQQSLDNSTWTDIYEGTSTSVTSPYLVAASVYYRIQVTSGCTSTSNTVTVTSSVAPGGLCTATYAGTSVSAPSDGLGVMIGSGIGTDDDHSFTSAIAGGMYSVASTNVTDFITVHEGTYNGTVVASGTGDLVFEAPNSDDYHIVLNTNTSCGTNVYARGLYVSRLNTPTTHTWTGGTSTSFTTASNWSTGSVPYNVDVVIPTGTTYDVSVPDGTNWLVRDFTIDASATLDMSVNAQALHVRGDFTNNGTINHTGTVYIYLGGANNTLSGSGDFYGGSASPFYISTGGSYTLQNNIDIRHLYVNTGGDFDMNGFDVSTEFFFQVGTFDLGTGTLSIWGGADASMWANPGDDQNPYFSTDGNFTPSTGTVYYCQGDAYSNTNQTIRTTTYYNLQVRTTNTYTATVGDVAGLVVNGDFTTLNTGAAGGVATLGFATDFNGNVTNGADVTLNGGALSHTVAGNWTDNGTFNSSTGTITFDGSSAQTINGSSGTSFYNFTNSNSSTGITMNSGFTVTNTLSMSGATANIDLNGNTLDLSSTGTISGESNTDRIYGTSGTITTTRTLNAPSSEDVGGMGAVLTSAANLGSTTISRGHAQQTGGGNTSLLRYYDITPTTNTGLSATLRFNYYDNEMNGQSADEADFALWRSTDGGTNWTLRDGTVTAASNYIELTGIDAFSRWTVSGKVNSPLPVELIGFKAECDFGNIDLQWTTASEQDNDYFSISGSKDGEQYSLLKNIQGAGNANVISEYNVKIQGQEYEYIQLSQTDYDGNTSIESVQHVQCDEGLGNDQFSVQLDKESNIIKIDFPNGNAKGMLYIVDVQGRILFEGDYRSGDGLDSESVYLNDPHGMYVIGFQSATGIVSQKVIW